VTIRFTKHALEKFSSLKESGVMVSKEEVITTIRSPDRIDHGRTPLLIAQSEFSMWRVLRVVYKIDKGAIIVITFYPGSKSQYEKR
jgi:hypothetical protein